MKAWVAIKSENPLKVPSINMIVTMQVENAELGSANYSVGLLNFYVSFHTFLHSPVRLQNICPCCCQIGIIFKSQASSLPI